jgi:tetratricopeptide (TPR) repeat protein
MMDDIDDEFFTLFDKIELLLVSGKFEEAIMECTAVLEKNPKDSGIRYYRGKALNRLGRFDKAAADLTKALEYGVQSAYLFVERSIALRAIGELEKAGEDFETALRLAVWPGGDEEMNSILQEGVKIMTDMADFTEG